MIENRIRKLEEYTERDRTGARAAVDTSKLTGKEKAFIARLQPVASRAEVDTSKLTEAEKDQLVKIHRKLRGLNA